MSFFKKLTGQLLSVIEWTDPTKDTIVYRFPMEGREIMMGSKLTVRESQVAVFVNKGRIADIFEPGMYRLATSNLPILTKLMSWKTGFNSPSGRGVLVSTRQFTDRSGAINP